MVRLDPRLAVQLFSHDGRDPWGRMLISAGEQAHGYDYSVGPNGVDETHLFADVELGSASPVVEPVEPLKGMKVEPERPYDRWFGRVMARKNQGPKGDDVFYEPTPQERRLRGILGFTPLVAGSLVLSAWLLVACPWQPRHERRRVELRRVILLASVPACLLYLAGDVALGFISHPVTWIGMPPELTLALSCALGSLLVATALRLRAGRADGSTRSPASPSSSP